MKRRDFYKGMIEVIQEGCDTLQKIDKAIAEAKAEISSGRYSQDVVNELREKINTLSKQSDEAITATLKTLSKHIDVMRSSLEDEMAMRGSDIVADAELLKYNLGEKELVSIINRNENNPTMVQLVLLHAKERGLDLGVRFSGNEVELNALNSLEYAARVTLRNHSQADIFEDMFGEGSEIEQLFNTIDPPPAVTLSYTDDVIANAVRLLSDNKCLNPDIQSEVIKEFENRPAVLSILRNAAVKGHNFDAVDMIDALIKNDSNNIEEE